MTLIDDESGSIVYITKEGVVLEQFDFTKKMLTEEEASGLICHTLMREQGKEDV